MTEAAQHISNCTCGQDAPGNLRVIRNQSSRSVYRLNTLAQLKRDPTHTTTLRNQFSRAMGKRFRELRGLIRKAIIDQDCFGMMNPTTQGLPQRRAFDFPRSQDKVEAFMDWLRKQHDQGILEIRAGQQIGEAVENAWTNTYIDSAYQKGIYRARQELVQAGYPVPDIEETGGISQAFNQPIHADRVGLLYSRTYNGLKGITDNMDTQISRVLSQAMADGKHPREMAKLLTRTISGPVGGLGITDTLGRFIPAERRARILARTEVIRAHHSATIQEYKNWQVEGVRVRAEWSTAGDARVCPECAMLEGRTYTLKEAEGMIPRHPQCRCIALPLDVTDEGGPVEGPVREPEPVEASTLFEGGPLDISNFPEDARTAIARTEWDSTNAVLRFGADRTDHSQRIDKLFDDYGVELPNPTQGYRGVKGTSYPTQVGEEFVDKGYFRWSGDPERAELFLERNQDVQYVTIRLPNGTRVLPGQHGFEMEAFVQRNSRFRVAKVEKKPNGGHFVDGEAVETFRHDIELVWEGTE